jgi:hypothetical protein
MLLNNIINLRRVNVEKLSGKRGDENCGVKEKIDAEESHRKSCNLCECHKKSSRLTLVFGQSQEQKTKSPLSLHYAKEYCLPANTASLIPTLYANCNPPAPHSLQPLLACNIGLQKDKVTLSFARAI